MLKRIVGLHFCRITNLVVKPFLGQIRVNKYCGEKPVWIKNVGIKIVSVMRLPFFGGQHLQGKDQISE